jgi:hypothetical protein
MFAKFCEKLKGWKTILWNGFLGLAPVLLVAVDKLQAMDLTPYMTWYMAIAAGVVVGGAGTWLRYVTTGPVGSKGEEEPAPEVKTGG